MRPQDLRALWPLLLLPLLTTQIPTTTAQSTNFTHCCVKALKEQSLDSSYTCGASYSEGKSPAKPVNTTLRWCVDECGGFQLSRIDHLSEWAGPLVGFLLPGLVFSMSIPRDWELQVPGRLFEPELSNCGSTPRTFVYLCIALVITTIETLRWVTVVFVYAGPMLVGGLYEMFLDNRLLQKLVGLQQVDRSVAIELRKRRILVTLLLGNLCLKNGGPETDAENFIVHASVTEAKARLHSLLESQASFGTVVGSPVIFYTGAFLYALLDASKNLGDNDTSHAIALGLWFSIVVIVAIICGCLLGCNNPAVLEGIVSDKTPPAKRKGNGSTVFLSRYRPVSIWKRGTSTHEWAENRQCGNEVALSDWIGYMGFFAALLISVPCWLAFTLSFNTPEIGLGCRSFMFLMYWVSQMVLIIIFILKQRFKNKWARNIAYVPRALALGLAFTSAIGGTVMQITGGFRNCICKGGIKAFINRNAPLSIQLATDTQLDRDSARKIWMPTGGVGLALVAMLCLYAWWYQRNIRQNCSTFIHGLEGFPPAGGGLFRLRASMADSPLPYRQYVQYSEGSALYPGSLTVVSQVSAARLQEVSPTGLSRSHLAIAHSSLPSDSGGGLRYIHVQKKEDTGTTLDVLELTWEYYPDPKPSGDFMWQGNRLAWVPIKGDEKGEILDGFLARSTAGLENRIFINAKGYGKNPPGTDPTIWTHLTLHRAQ